MTDRDRLFVLRPSFEDKQARYFCPYSAQVIGFLTYYPEVRDTIELVELGWEKPREPLASLLGESRQGAPMLVLAETSPRVVDGVTVAQANGHHFVEQTKEIVQYLAVTRGVPLPH